MRTPDSPAHRRGSVKTRQAIVPILLLAIGLGATPAHATETGAVASARSFPSAAATRTDPRVETTTVTGEGDWGGIEQLDVPESPDPIQQARQQAASRSATRDTAPSQPIRSGDPDAIARLAIQQSGAPYMAGGNTPAGWDCSGFVQWVYSQAGIQLPRTSGAQAAVGQAVASLADARPGDIIANSMHAAIYVGDGLVANALLPGLGTQVTGLNVFSGGYSIRRVVE